MTRPYDIITGVIARPRGSASTIIQRLLGFALLTPTYASNRGGQTHPCKQEQQWR